MVEGGYIGEDEEGVDGRGCLLACVRMFYVSLVWGDWFLVFFFFICFFLFYFCSVARQGGSLGTRGRAVRVGGWVGCPLSRSFASSRELERGMDGVNCAGRSACSQSVD